MESLPDTIRQLVITATAVDSIWSVVLRGLIWLAVSIVIIVSLDRAGKNQKLDLKSNLGFFLMFLLITGSLIYLLFGYTSV